MVEETDARPVGAARGLARLDLADFRSYPGASLAFDGRPVALTGANGAGKTNVLEAISLFSPGRGLRSAAPADLARRGGAGGWAAAVRVRRDRAEARLGVGVDPASGPRRQVRIDGASAPAVSAATSRSTGSRRPWTGCL